MTAARLHLVETGTFKAGVQTCTIGFPPVPQGQTWTGSIAISVPFGDDLQGIIWTLFRDGTPFLSWEEFGVATDVQAISHEQLVLVGTFIGTPAEVPLFIVTATWTGAADDSRKVPFLWPSVTGAARGLVQVYNSNGPDAPLAVVPASMGDAEASQELTSAGTSINLMAAPPSGHTYSIWELGLQITAASISTETGAKWLTGTIQTTAPSKALLQGQVSTVPGSADSCWQQISLHGLTLAAGQTLQLVAGAYTGANANVIGHAIYTTN